MTTPTTPTKPIETWTDEELLTTVGGKRAIKYATADLAHQTIFELRETLTETNATRLAAAVELGRRTFEAAALPPGTSLPNRHAVERWAHPRLATLYHEQLWVLCLDGRNGLRTAVRVAEGGVHGLHVSPRDVLRTVVKNAASSFVLVHNHPSGDPTPSTDDVEFTKALSKGADVIATPLLDHVVVARDKSSSMFELGLLKGTP
jgi:DNA repair protein RadC